jgi:hypothetical protein
MKKIKNMHTYTTQVTETLPPGRFLEAGENVQEGDLVCYKNQKARVWTGILGINFLAPTKFYRPEPKKSKPKYRFLKAGDTLRKGDQVFIDKWIQQPVYEDQKMVLTGVEIYKRRRRLHVKTS